MNLQHELPVILNKISPLGIDSLYDLVGESFTEIHRRVNTVLTKKETRLLHTAVQQLVQENRLYETRLFTRANPQLQNMIRLGISSSATAQNDYDSMFGGRSRYFVAPGAVSSMFSPAAYLTELYREAKTLHPVSSAYHLEQRRPDLGTLLLNQHNLDQSLPVLEVSNELLMEGAKTGLGTNETGVLTHLSSWRHSGMTPHHAAFERVRQAVVGREGADWPVSTAPDVMGLMSGASLQGMQAGFSPELYAILSETLTDGNIPELYTRNFGTMSPQALMSMTALSDYYAVSDEPLQYFAGVYSSGYDYPNNQYSYADIDGDGQIMLRQITRTYPGNPACFNAVTLLPVASDRYELRFNFAQVSSSAPLSITLNDVVIFSDTEFSAQTGVDYRVGVNIGDEQLTQPQLFKFVFSDLTASAQFVFAGVAPEYFLLELNKWVRLHQATGLEPMALESAVRSSGPHPVQVNTHTAGVQAGNYTISLSDGGWLVVWNSDGLDGSYSGICQKRYSATGEALSGDVQVNTTTPGGQHHPRAARLADGGWVVCWENDVGDIYQQRFDAEGERMGTERLVNPYNHVSSQAQVTGLVDGGWVIAWDGTVDADSDNNIYQLRFDQAGTAIGQPGRVNTTTTDVQALSSFSQRTLIPLGDGGWVIAWMSHAQDGSGKGVYFQRYDAAGNPAGAETRVNNTTEGEQDQTCLAAHPDGGWLIVWTSSFLDGSDTVVYQRRYNSTGQPLGDESRVNTTNDEQKYPTICTLADGGWVVAWGGPDTSEAGVYFQRFDVNGAAMGGEVQVNTYETSAQDSSSVCAVTGGGWVVTYCSMAQDGDNWGIYQQQYNASGVVASEGWEIHSLTLRRVADMQLYMQRYGIDHEQALILCNADISEQPFGNASSQFARLFNTPPLNGFVFTADGPPVDLNPDSAGDDPRKATLARTFHADDVSLYRLLQIVDYSDTDGLIPNDIPHLSALYLASLLARVHGLSIDELAWLLRALGEDTTHLITISDDRLRQLIARIHAAVSSLTALKWSASQLFVMTTTEYPDTPTPEIRNLIDTINSALHGSTLTGAALIDAMAPQVAALLRLGAHTVAASLLKWIDQLKPGGLSVDNFWADIQDSVPTPEAIQFCHALAQLALVFQATGLDERSLDVLVINPDMLITLPDGVTVAPHDARTLLQLGSYRSWTNALGGDAATVLSALYVDTLTPAMVATAMGKDPHLLSQAAMQALNHGQIADDHLLSSWPEIEIVLQWVYLSDGLGVAPQVLSDWLDLDYLNSTPPALVYGDWDKVATALTAGVAPDNAAAFEGGLREALSTALVACYLREIADPVLELSSRDDVYGYQLLDNQVSSQVMTTRIAEAIASVQLYINRALDGVEPEVNSNALARPFFTDWSRYNKRYSTWAGVSQLVYYPENYIDPTVRQGQTTIMDTLLQSINQSGLTDETVEGAFGNYLTNFEQVADLEVLSGYHDHTDNLQGMTWLIGNRRGNAQNYYWRSLNHDLAQNGTFPANAWSDWRSVDCAINPHQQVIRPVVRNGRLHLVWLERTEQADDSSGSVVRRYAHELKLVQQYYDGTWSAPQSHPVDDYLNFIGITEEEVPGLYCAEDPHTQDIVVMLYKRQPDTVNASAAGFSVGVDMQPGIIDSEWYRLRVFWQFDTDTLRRINNRFTDGIIKGPYLYTFPRKVDSSLSYTRGDQLIHGTSISTLQGSYLDNLTLIDDDFPGYIYLNVQDHFAVMKFERYQANPDDLFFETKQYDSMVHTLPPKGKVIFPLRVSSSSTLEGHILEGTICPEPEKSPRRVSFFVNGAVLNNIVYDKAIIEHIDVNNIVHTFEVSSLTSDSYIYYELNHTGNLKSQIISLFSDNAEVHRCEYQFSGDEPVIDTDIYFERLYITDTYDGGELDIQRNEDTFPITQTYGEMKADYGSAGTLHYYYVDLTKFDGTGKYDLNTTLKIHFSDSTGPIVGTESFVVELTRSIPLAMHLHNTASHAQYLQWGPYRTRLNTTFAHQLIVRAAKGLDSILTLDSQQLPEPPLGHGGYVNVTLPAYDSTLHGVDRNVRLELFDESAPVEQQAYFSFAGITLNEAPQTLTLFVPVSQQGQGDPVNFPVTLASGLAVFLSCASGRPRSGTLHLNTTTLQPTSFTRDVGWNGARDPDIVPMPAYVEPMDFRGANALYFWELFYYTPMLIAQRMLLEQNFEGAQRWLEYVWNPSGYFVDGVLQSYYWNVRPLLEDTSWNSVPLDSTDPDAVAQQDPMHYKLCTFMRTLDLLLARGDAAYRQLERDTLSEAKMWYAQALHLLGDEPYLPLGGGWQELSLGDAADAAVQQALHQGLAALRNGPQPDTQTASSLTHLFLPQANEILLDYWQRTGQRLYNLRHNLSLEGQPLALPLYAAPADPAGLHNAAVASALGSPALPAAYLPHWRFPPMLENARSMVNQLSQFGSTLLSVRERQDAEALSALLQGQAKELMLLSIDIQNRTIAELDAEHESLTQTRRGAQQRLDSFTRLYDENISAGEIAAMALHGTATGLFTASNILYVAAGVAKTAPNIFGLAVGGSDYGGIPNALGYAAQSTGAACQITADQITQSEAYRRRRQEWEIQRNNAEAEVAQCDAQLQGNALRREAAQMQKDSLTTQQKHTQTQLAFLQGKFSNQALYSWMNGRLSALYFQLYDLTVGRCLMAEQSYRYVTQETTASFIKPGAWQNSYAGLLSSETLLLGLAQMEDAYLRWDARSLEVTRTLSLADVYASMPGGAFDLDAKIDELLNAGSGSAGTATCGIAVNGTRLLVFVTLSELGLRNDYPDDMQLGDVRRIKQLSVSLPALVGPYQDIQATLAYGGSTSMPRGCNALAVSHGLNDSGQFQLDFNDGKFLPFEGIAIDDSGLLTLTFPNATAKQKSMLLSLSDVIMHIRYTIRS